MKVKQALSGNTTASIKFTKKYTPDETDRKKNINTLYENLQSKLDADNRANFTINYDDVYLSCGNNKELNNSYNTAGNIDIYCKLPFDSSVIKPNYIQYLLNTSYNDKLLSILFTWLKSNDILTDFVSSTNTSGVNPESNVITSINMKNELSGSNYLLKNWNIGRIGWSAENVKKMRNYFAIKFNELIDHIITNDVVVADNAFKSKWQALFSNSNGVLLSYANGTLMAPSLVNWFANERKINQDALMVCGYVPKGVEFFPFGNDNDLNAFKNKNLRCWWFDNSKFTGIYKESLSENNLYVPLNVANKLTGLGKFNYPFRTNNWNNEANRGSVETNYSINYEVIDSSFTGDNYYWRETLDNNYAKITYGSCAQDAKVTDKTETISKTNFEVTFPLNLLYDNITKGSYYAWCSNKTNTYSKFCWAKTRYADYSGTNIGGSTNVSGWQVKYDKISSISEDKFKAWVKEQCDEWKATKNNGSDATSKVNFTWFARPSNVSRADYDNNYTLTDNAGTDHYWNNNCWRQTLDYPSPCDDPVVTACNCKDGGQIKNLGWFNKWGAAYNEGKVARATVSFTATYPKHVNGGWFKSYGSLYTNKFIYTSTNPKLKNTVYDFEAFAKQQRLICLWKTNKPLYVFNNAVFEYWYQILSCTDNCQLVLNKLRELIKNKPEMILVNRLNKVFGNIIQYYLKRNNRTDVSFINLPLGAPLVYIPDSYLLDYRFYHAAFTFGPIWKGSFDKIVKNDSVCNVVNKVDVRSKDLEDKNYLDVVFSSLISKSIMLNTVISEDDYFAVLIPNKGQNILDVISPGMGGLVYKDICVVKGEFSTEDKDMSPVYDFSYGKIILTFKPFATSTGTEAIATLSTAYKLIDSVYVPVIALHRNGNYVELKINTKSDIANKDIAVDQSEEPATVPKGLDNNSTENNTTTPTTPISTTNTNEEEETVNETFKANAKFLSSNRMYIYVSSANYQDFTSSVRGKGVVESDKNIDDNNVACPLLTIAYHGLDALYPSNCLRMVQL